jgi:hypothetical protein
MEGVDDIGSNVGGCLVQVQLGVLQKEVYNVLEGHELAGNHSCNGKSFKALHSVGP